MAGFSCCGARVDEDAGYDVTEFECELAKTENGIDEEGQ